MRDVAKELNLSETAFLVPKDDGFNLRWFTPTVEVELCGHATLASAHILWEKGTLKPDQQAISFDKGYFYPGPAVKNVTIDMAPADSQAALKGVVPATFDQWINQFPKVTSLPADQQVIAFDIWDRTIGKK